MNTERLRKKSAWLLRGVFVLTEDLRRSKYLRTRKELGNSRICVTESLQSEQMRKLWFDWGVRLGCEGRSVVATDDLTP